MTMVLHPKNRTIMVKVEDGDKVTESGIIIPESVNKELAESAVVLGADPEVTVAKEGDTIFFKAYSLSEVEIGGEKYGFLKEDDVLAVKGE